MTQSIETVVDDLRRLLNEEAHLIGQELQDALSHDELHRLHALSTVLNDVDELFERRRPRRAGR